MRYLSTRGAWRDAPPSFSEILLEGLAPDGGLAVPESYPRLAPAAIESLRELPYAALAEQLLSRFVTDIPAAELAALIERTYTPAVFDDAAITPVTALEPGVFLLHLSNGPTLAFKDIALQLLGNLFEHVRRGSGAPSTSSARRPATPAARPSTRCAASAASGCSCSRPTAG